jgi:uncharacterized protein YbbK (DUF523 family)
VSLRVGVSACLLGRPVRWDGGHKLDPCITDILGPLFEWVPGCPEEEHGLGVPREALRLEGDPDAPRLVFRDSRADITDRMEAWAEERVSRLARLDLCGYILKSDSPSCGMERVTVAAPDRGREPAPGNGGQGIGLFARVLMKRLPLLPVEEEGRLHDPRHREAFVERVFAYANARDHA